MHDYDILNNIKTRADIELLSDPDEIVNFANILQDRNCSFVVPHVSREEIASKLGETELEINKDFYLIDMPARDTSPKY